MSKVRVSCFSVSLDGYAAGPRQSLENPLGERGPELFEWFFPTRTFKQMHGQEGGDAGSTGVDNDWAQRGMENVGAWIMGRNMFGPVRGPWPDDSWKGWWGDEPPYHVPVFVLTHHPRKPLEMKGGTTFYFVTDGIHAALQRAREAAGKDKDVRIGGGVATIRQFLRGGPDSGVPDTRDVGVLGVEGGPTAGDVRGLGVEGIPDTRDVRGLGLIDELHLAIRPVLLGSGENLFAGLDLAQLGYRCAEHVSTELAMHVVLRKDASSA